MIPVVTAELNQLSVSNQWDHTGSADWLYFTLRTHNQEILISHRLWGTSQNARRDVQTDVCNKWLIVVTRGAREHQQRPRCQATWRSVCIGCCCSVKFILFMHHRHFRLLYAAGNCIRRCCLLDSCSLTLLLKVYRHLLWYSGVSIMLPPLIHISKGRYVFMFSYPSLNRERPIEMQNCICQGVHFLK